VKTINPLRRILLLALIDFRLSWLWLVLSTGAVLSISLFGLITNRDSMWEDPSNIRPFLALYAILVGTRSMSWLHGSKKRLFYLGVPASIPEKFVASCIVAFVSYFVTLWIPMLVESGVQLLLYRYSWGYLDLINPFAIGAFGILMESAYWLFFGMCIGAIAPRYSFVIAIIAFILFVLGMSSFRSVLLDKTELQNLSFWARAITDHFEGNETGSSFLTSGALSKSRLYFWYALSVANWLLFAATYWLACFVGIKKSKA
jgi:hypothetical protein